MNNEQLPPHLELSREEVIRLFETVAEALVLYGDIAPDSKYPGLLPAAPEGAPPRTFERNLPAGLVRDIFYADDEVMIAGTGIASYHAPHRLGDDDQETVEQVNISYTGHLIGTDGIEQHGLISITRDGSIWRSIVDTQYSRHDRTISPNDIVKGTGALDDDRVMDFIRDDVALERPLSLDDAEYIRRVVEYIAK